MARSVDDIVAAAKGKPREVMTTLKSTIVPPGSLDGPTPEGFFHTPLMRSLMPFVNGGLSGMVATSVIQPVDMVKVRIQLAPTDSKPHFGSVFNQIRRDEGFSRLYSGLSAGLLRQAVYTTARLGFFDKFQDALKRRAQAKGRNVTFLERAIAAAGAGGLAAAIGNPADLALIRMQSDGLKPIEKRANYRGVMDALTRIVRNEGALTLWTGAYPTIARAMALNLGQLACFADTKERLSRVTDWGVIPRTMVASAVAGFAGSVLSLPADFVKTRLQKQGKTGEYRGMWDCIKKTWQREGSLRFYRGFGTYYVRIAPHA